MQRYGFWARAMRLHKMAPLSHTSSERPTTLRSEEIASHTSIVQISENRIVLRAVQHSGSEVFFNAFLGLGVGAFMIGMSIKVILEFFTRDGLTVLFFALPFAVAGLLVVVFMTWTVLPWRIPGNRYIVFDREAGTVTLPGLGLRKPVTIAFPDLVVYSRYWVSLPAFLRHHQLIALRPDGDAINISLTSGGEDQPPGDWAFYLWYMDRSRSLPPSPVFSAHLASDFAARTTGDN